ncbi:MAG TPA: hypothetical protein VGF55_26830 [Gemmataceae bacterium]
MADRSPTDPNDQTLSELAPHAADPGGAHRKGYSAEPGPTSPVPDDDPVPLAADEDVRGHVQRPDEDAALPPTGREDPPTYPPEDRTLGYGR